MEKFSQLAVVEAGNNGASLPGHLAEALQPFTEEPVAVQSLAEALQTAALPSPQIIFLHTDLVLPQGLQSFQKLQAAFPLSAVVVVGDGCNKESWTRFLDAGAEDCVRAADLTEDYLHKTAVRYSRRRRIQRQRQRQFEGLWEALQYPPNVAVQWYNRAGEVVFWNKASERIFGLSAEEVQGRKIDELFAVLGEDNFWLHKILNLTGAAARSETLEWPFRYPNGSEGWCISTLFPVCSPEGEEWFACMDVEITERKRAERQLQESESRYYNLFNQASDAIFINDGRGRFLDVNERACRLLGRTREELLRLSVPDVYSVEELAKQPIMWERLRAGERTRLERNMLTANGKEVPVEITAQLVNPDRIMAIVRDVSERKTADAALRESRFELEQIYDNNTDLIFLLRAGPEEAYRFVSVNRTFAETTGMRKEDVAGRDVREVLLPENLHTALAKYRQAVNAGQKQEWEETSGCGPGSVVNLISVTPIQWEAGEVRLLVVVRNVTDERRTREALRQSEEKYRLLVEQQADAITIFNKEGSVLEVNQSATQLLQYTEEEYKGMNFLNVLLPEDLEKNPVDFATLMKGLPTIKQRRMRRKDGTVVETEVHTKRLWDGHFLASVRDLTERLAVQHQLEREKALSDSIINSLPGLFYLFTQEGKYLLWNRQLEVMSGYSGEEIKSMRPLDFFDEDEKGIVQASIDRVFATGQSSVEAKLFTKDKGKIPCYLPGIAVRYADTVCLLGTGIDLSAVKRLERELSEQKIGSQKRLMQAMIDAQEKEKANLGLELHDNVNQILSVVKMYLNILHTDGPTEGITLPHTIKLLNTAIDEIRNLSHSLAVSYRFEAGLVEALREMVEKVKLTRDFSISLVTPPGLDDYLNAAQKLALYRIVQEQLSNIMKYAKATEVAIAVGLTAADISLRIDDNGKGFDPAKTEKGLGLSNITTRAEALGGKVTVVSSPGAGCQVSARIPLRQEEE